MALLWFDGFDHYGLDETKLTEGPYNQADAAFTLSEVNPRTGNRCLRRSDVSEESYILKTIVDIKNPVGFGFAFHMSQMPDFSFSYPVAELFDSSGASQIVFYINPDGSFSGTLGIGGPEVFSSNAGFVFDSRYNHMEVGVLSSTIGVETEVILFSENFSSGLDPYTIGDPDFFSLVTTEFGTGIEIKNVKYSSINDEAIRAIPENQYTRITFYGRVDINSGGPEAQDADIAIMQLSNSGSAIVSIQLSRDATNTGSLERMLINGNFIGDEPLTVGEWYFVDINLDWSSGELSYTVTGETEGLFDSGVTSFSTANPINQLIFEIDVFSGDSERLNDSGTYTDINLYGPSQHQQDGQLEIRLNGVTVFSSADIRTANTEEIGYSKIGLSFGSSGSHGVTTDIDDFFIWDDSGAWNNSFLGDRRSFLSKPNQDTNIADFEPSSGSFGYKMIDEDSPDDDSTFILAEADLLSGSPLSGTSEFEIGNVAAGVSSISAVMVVSRAAKTDETSADLSTSINSGSNSVSETAHTLTTSYQYYSDVYEYDPATIASLTRDGFNSLSVSVTAEDLDPGEESPGEESPGEESPGEESPGSGLSQILPEPASEYPVATDGNSSSLDIPSGNTSFVSIPNDAALNPTSAIDVEWRGVINGTGSTVQTVVEKAFTSHVDPFYQYRLGYRTSDKLVVFDVAVGGTRVFAFVTGVTEIVPGIRIHIDGYYDGSEIGIRVNGRTVVTEPASGSIGSYETELLFGKHRNVTTETVNANYDELRIWSGKRTDEEIILNMDRQLVGNEVGLSGLWLFNEGSGTIVADSTSNSNDGAINGSTSWDSVTFTWDGTNDEKWHYPGRLVIPTYDGSGQVVHPSVVYIPAALNGYNWWMGFTPYPSGDSQFENPSIIASNDGFNWEVPVGVTNPLISSPTGGSNFNSDVNLIAIGNDSSTELWMYYRATVSGTSTFYRITSIDGVNWSSPESLFSVPGAEAASPWVFHTGSEFVMVTTDVDATPFLIKRRTSSDGATWSSEASVALSGMPVGREPWHIDGTRDPVSGRIHIMLNSATDVGGQNARIHYAFSDNECESITVVDYVTTGYYTDITHEYKASILIDPANRDRYWIYSGDQHTNGNWWPYLMMRRIQSGNVYQEKALH